MKLYIIYTTFTGLLAVWSTREQAVRVFHLGFSRVDVILQNARMSLCRILVMGPTTWLFSLYIFFYVAHVWSTFWRIRRRRLDQFGSARLPPTHEVCFSTPHPWESIPWYQASNDIPWTQISKLKFRSIKFFWHKFVGVHKMWVYVS
jgi:hypothetical protein